MNSGKDRSSSATMLIAFFLASCAMACAVATPQQPAPRSSTSPGHAATFTGRVLGLDDEPIDGAAIWVVPDASTLAALGFILDIDRSTIPKALQPHFGRGVTDADGGFRVTTNTVLTADPPHNPDSMAGMLHHEHPRIFVVKPGFAARAVRCRPFDGLSFDAGSVRLEPSVLVTGRVLGEDGRPIGGAEIQPWVQGGFAPLPGTQLTGADVEFMQENGGNPSWLQTTTSEPDGRFVLDGIWAGESRLWFGAPDHLGDSRFIDVPRQASIDMGAIELSLGRVLTGSVVDRDGNPIAGARLFVRDQIGSNRQPVEAFPDAAPLLVGILGTPRATTDESGTFRITGLSDRTTWVIADADCLDPGRLALEPVGDQHGLLFMLAPQSTLQVLVRDASTGKPVTTASCLAWRLAGERAMWHDRVELPVSPGSREAFAVAAGLAGPQLSADDGLFQITGSGSCATDIFVTARGYGRRLFTQAGAPVPSTAACTIELEPEATISGRVLDASGKPAVGVVVEAQCPLRCREDTRADWTGFTHPPLWGERWLTTTVLLPRFTTDKLGRYKLHELFAGTWTVQVVGVPEGSPRASFSQAKVKLASGAQADLQDLRSG